MSELHIIAIILFSTPLAIFIVSIVFFYNRSKEHDRQFKSMQETLALYPKGKEVFNQSLIQSKLEIQEQALSNVTKELHSNIGHLAALININLSELSFNSNPDIQDNVRETKSLSKQLMTELSAVSPKHSDYITSEGFAKAWEQELNKLIATNRYKVIFNTTGEPYHLSPDREVILFRLCQEILNNVVQHARAKTITVSLSYLPTYIRIEIADDGIGFNIMEVFSTRIANHENSGLIKLQRRAIAIKATVDMNSKVGKGSDFVIDIYKNQ